MNIARHTPMMQQYLRIKAQHADILVFHQTHGYYAQGVGPETATLPTGWRRRLVRVENPNTGGYAGL